MKSPVKTKTNQLSNLSCLFDFFSGDGAVGNNLTVPFNLSIFVMPHSLNLFSNYDYENILPKFSSIFLC